MMSGAKAAEVVRALRDVWVQRGADAAHQEVTALSREELETIVTCYVGSGAGRHSS